MFRKNLNKQLDEVLGAAKIQSVLRMMEWKFQKREGIAMKLREIKPGGQGRIIGYGSAAPAYRQKLLGMGLIRGRVFTLLRAAPMGDPVELSIDGSHVTLRKAEADALDVEMV